MSVLHRANDDQAKGNRPCLTAWLVDSGSDLPAETRQALDNSLYGSIPIFVGGLLNTIVVSSAIALRIEALPFLIWAMFELLLGAVRVPLLVMGHRAIAQGRPGPTDIYIKLSLCWAASVGYGAFICIASGDWIASTLACMSGAAMVGGICFRNFAAPRLVAAMIALSLGPCALAAVMSGEAVLLVIAFQVPLYAVSMTLAAFRMNKMLVRTMLAERENDRRARHDALTGLLNRAGLGRELADRSAKGDRFALLYLDLDGFKGINDTFGHQVGDELLKAVAERLRSTCRPEDAIARIGGDEFVILSADSDAAAAAAIGERLVSAIGEHGFFIGSEAAFVGLSVGIALYPDHGEDLGALLGEADAALYQAKYWGRSRCVTARSAPPRPEPGARPVNLATAQRMLLDRDAA